MKYVKKIAAIFCAVMMVVTINASVVNAASTDEGNPTVITLISGSTMSGSAAGIFAEGETDHYFKFSLGSSSSYPDVMAVYLTNPDGCNYQMEITDPQNGIIYRGIGKAGTNDKVIKIPKPRTMTTYYLHVYAAFIPLVWIIYMLRENIQEVLAPKKLLILEKQHLIRFIPV